MLRYYGYQESNSNDYNCDRIHRLITFQNSLFINNSAAGEDSSYGGVAAVTCTSIELFSNEFYENSAYLGGGFSIYASLTNASDNIFIKNRAGLAGPALYLNGLYNDTDYQFFIDNSIFFENSGDQSSAIMFAFMHYGWIYNCTFKNNEGIEGGAVGIYYWSSYAACYIHILDCIFINNIMTDRDSVSGGGITAAQWPLSNEDRDLECLDLSNLDVLSDNGIDTIKSQLITKVDPPNKDSFKSLRVYVVNSIFKNNSFASLGMLVGTLVVYNCEFINSYNEEYGGAIEVQYSWFYIKNSKFINNIAEDAGGAISTLIISYVNVIEEFELPDGCPVVIESNYFENNHAQLGGAIQIGITNNIYNNTFFNNSGLFGGGIAFAGKYNNIYDNLFNYDHVTTLGGCLFRTSYTNEDYSDMAPNYGLTSNTSGNSGNAANGTDGIETNIYGNEFHGCEAFVGGCVYLGSLDPNQFDINQQSDINDIFNVSSNLFDSCYASDIGGGLALGQQYYTNFLYSNKTQFSNLNEFINCTADNRHNDYTSYPISLYIDTSGLTEIAPGINKGARLGGLDIFGGIFESFIVTDWNKDETHFEFIFNSYDPRFQISTVDSGSLTLGDAKIQFSIINDTFNTSVTIGLTTNMDEELLGINDVNYTFNLTECPTGYGYTSEDTCELCQLGFWNTRPGKQDCHECVDGLSCRGSTNVEIETNFWWDDEYPNVDIALPCRAGQCCQSDTGCDYNDTSRCPDDRDYNSLGCGICITKNGKLQSAKHGSNKCGDCDEYNGSSFNGIALLIMILWPLVLILIFGLVCQRVSIVTFYKITVIQISVLLLIDFYQSLPTVLLFEPPNGVTLFIHIAMAQIPTLQDGICFFDEMTILERWQYNLVLPFIMLAESVILCVIERFSGIFDKYRDARNREDTTIRVRFDGIKGVLFALYFTFIPIIWNCAHLIKCIEFSGKDIFWNAPGQDCDTSVRGWYIALAIIWTILFILCMVGSIEKLFPKYQDYKNLDEERKYIESLRCGLQQLEPFTYMIYTFGYRTQREKHEIEALKRAQDDSMYDVTRYTQSGRHLTRIGGGGAGGSGGINSNDLGYAEEEEPIYYSGVATTDPAAVGVGINKTTGNGNKSNINRVVPLAESTEADNERNSQEKAKAKTKAKGQESGKKTATDDEDDDDDENVGLMGSNTPGGDNHNHNHNENVAAINETDDEGANDENIIKSNKNALPELVPNASSTVNSSNQSRHAAAAPAASSTGSSSSSNTKPLSEERKLGKGKGTGTGTGAAPSQLKRQSTTIRGIPTFKKLSRQITTLKQLRKESILKLDKKRVNIHTREDEKWGLYVAWFIPFIRKFVCVFVHACVTGSQLHEDIAFITTNVCVVTLIVYQLFASNLSTIKDNSKHIYILYLFFWLIIMVVSGSSRIVAENENVYDNLTTAIKVLMWSPVFIVIVFCLAIWFDKFGFKPVTIESRANY